MDGESPFLDTNFGKSTFLDTYFGKSTFLDTHISATKKTSIQHPPHCSRVASDKVKGEGSSRKPLLVVLVPVEPVLVELDHDLWNLYISLLCWHQISLLVILPLDEEVELAGVVGGADDLLGL